MIYRREIDGLRALAVIPVILFHAGIKMFSGGFVGVDIFFVISGYLITSIIILEIEAGRFSILDFYERRARRILPALFLVMFSCIPFAWLWLLPHDLQDFAQSLIGVSTFVSNILFWLTSGYFETASELKPLLHTWSLAVEEQFYLFFPIFILLVWQFGKRWVSYSLIIIFIVSLLTAQWGSSIKPDATFYLLPTRGWELLTGSLIAFYMTKKDLVILNENLNQFASVLGLILILYSIFQFNKQLPFPSFYALVPTFGAGLIILCANKTTFVGKLLGHQFFVGIGLISYSANLWHQPLLAFAKYRSLKVLGDTFLILLILGTFMLAYITWKYVEAPFRSKKLLNRNQIFKFSFLGIMFFSSLGLYGHLNKGFENRFKFVSAYKGDIGHDTFHQYVSHKYHLCSPIEIANEAEKWNGFIRCMQSKQTQAANIALIGDSHAEHLFLGLADEMKNKNIVYYTKSSQPFIKNSKFNNIFNYVLANNSIDTVILSMYWIGIFDIDPKNSALEDNLTNTLKALTMSGKKVYLLDDVPRFSFKPEYCKYVVEGFNKSNCDTSKNEILKYEKKYLPILKKVATQIKGVKFVELRDELCDNKNCSMVKDGVLMYRDSNHLNILGSKFVATQIISKFPELNI